jgi:hypothetical protein
MKRNFVLFSLYSLTLFSCGDSKTNLASTNSTPNETKKAEVKKDTLASKKEEKATEENEKDEKLTRNGTYVNSQKSRLTISECSKTGLKYKFALKGVCDGFEENGLAVFDGSNKAEVFSEDGTVIYSFTFKKDGTIDFNLNIGPEFYGMDCIKFFDNQFEKK